MEEKKFTKREKIIAVIAGILIIGLSCVIVFQYFTIIKAQKQISSLSDSVLSTTDSGKIVWINPETAVTIDESTSDNTSDNSSEIKEYVINKNSKKIHSPDCDSAKKTLDKNKETVSWSEEEYLKALDEGYSPCSVCQAGR